MSWVNVVCPFCIWNRPIGAQGGGLPLGEYDGRPSDVPVIQFREVSPGPGRGHKGRGRGGFPLSGSMTLSEALEDPQYSTIAEQLRSRLVELVKDYMRVGVINQSEFIDL